MEYLWALEYFPEIYSVTGIMFYSFLGYVFAITLGYYCTPREYTIEDFREAIRKNRKTEKVSRPF